MNIIVSDITTRTGNKMYIATENGITTWFKEKEDRDFYAEGGRIETSPGRDPQNRWFKARLSGHTPITSTTSKSRSDTGESAGILRGEGIEVKETKSSTSKKSLKEVLKKIHKEIEELIEEL